jgi:hypothetical protein
MADPAATTSMSTVTLTSLLGANAGIVLQRGDNDKRRTWGGKQHTGTAGDPVRALQDALRRVGTANFKSDGDFGSKTDDAVRRFQWYLVRMTHRLRVAPEADETHGALEASSLPRASRSTDSSRFLL